MYTDENIAQQEQKTEVYITEKLLFKLMKYKPRPRKVFKSN